MIDYIEFILLLNTNSNSLLAKPLFIVGHNHPPLFVWDIRSAT